MRINGWISSCLFRSCHAKREFAKNKKLPILACQRSVVETIEDLPATSKMRVVSNKYETKIKMKVDLLATENRFSRPVS